jgi:hypothetical protein
VHLRAGGDAAADLGLDGALEGSGHRVHDPMLLGFGARLGRRLLRPQVLRLQHAVLENLRRLRHLVDPLGGRDGNRSFAAGQPRHRARHRDRLANVGDATTK